MKLSACWITKNEEANIARSINSVKGLVDEMIVTDTGSTDKTVEIARSLGARVETFEWVNDFAAARNFGLQFATGDVVLLLDADEWYEPALTQKDRATVEALLSGGTANVLLVLRNNIDPDTELTIAVDYMPRIFLNADGFHFENAIHEAPAFKPPVLARVKTTDALCMVHNGYGIEASKAKYARNFMILNEEAEKSPDGAYKALNMAYLVREAVGMNRTARALEALNWLLLHPDDANGAFTGRGYLLAAVLYTGFLLAGRQPGAVRADLLYDAWVKGLPRRFPKAPVGHLAKAFYEGYVLRNERYLFEHLDGDIAAGNRVVGAVDADDADVYRRSCAFLYDRAAQAAALRGKMPQAFDFVTKALRMDPDTLLSDSLPLFFRCVKGLPWQDVVSFLNQNLDITKLGNLDMLFTSLRHEGGKEMYIYYCKKALDLGKAKKGDFWFLLIALGKYREAAAAAFEGCAGRGEATASQIVMLATLCAEDPSIAAECSGALLAGERAALDVILDGREPDVATATVMAANYGFLAFARDRAFANRLAAQFPVPGVAEADCRVKLQYYQNSSLYKEFFEEVELPDKIVGPDLSEAVAAMYLLAGDYAQGLARLAEHAHRLRMDRTVLAVADAAADAADAETAGRARGFLAIHRPLYEQWARCASTVEANVPIPADEPPVRGRLAAAGAEALLPKAEYAGAPLMAGECPPLLAYIDAAMAAKAYGAALDACALLLRDENTAPLAREYMAILFARAKNKPLAAQLQAEAARDAAGLAAELAAPAQTEAVRALAGRVAGYQSKRVLLSALAGQSGGAEALADVARPAKLAYYHPSLAVMPKHAALVDCAAGDGSAARLLWERYGRGNVGRVYCFAADAEQADQCEKALKYVPNARVARAAPAAGGPNAVDAVVEGQIGVLKLPATGAAEILTGAAEHIAAGHPAILAGGGNDIAVLTDIADAVDRVCPGYRFYLRCHAREEGAPGVVLVAVFGED